MDLAHALDTLLGGSASNNATVLPLHEILDPPLNTTIKPNSRIVRPLPDVIALVIAYALVIIVSLIGNILVCYVIYKNRRLHTVTNVFIANLACSDIMMTVLNIPLNIVRNILDNWPFGSIMCGFVNATLMTSVYVSTFTMAMIALDRYSVIMFPLRPRISLSVGFVLIAIIWLFAILLSLPFAIFAKVETVDLLLVSVDRCRLSYPDPADIHEQAITLSTMICQYALPMTITAFAYGVIVRKLWSREVVGQATANQQLSHRRARRKTIKMLIIVVVIFCLCWLPLNLYHLLTDFHPDSARFHYNSAAYLACLYVAMSSVCYNPFIYCWLNESFRAEIRKRLRRMCERSMRIHPAIDVDGQLIRADHLAQEARSASGSAMLAYLHGSKVAKEVKNSLEIETSCSKDTERSHNDSTPLKRMTSTHSPRNCTKYDLKQITSKSKKHISPIRVM